jgi:hypothetical protein
MPPYAWSSSWLAELGLIVGQPERVLNGLKVSENRIFKHLSEKHNIGHSLEVQLTRYLPLLWVHLPRAPS